MDESISLFCSAIRTEIWPEFCHAAFKNDVRIEIVFVGSKKPTFVLPKRVKFIYSNVKPSQCAYIAMMNCSGDYLLNTADDIHFSPNSIDLLYEAAKQQSEMTIISPCYTRYGGRSYLCKANKRMPLGTLPLLPVGSFTGRSVWRNMGLSRMYISTYQDLDMAMRFYQVGGKVVYCDESSWHEFLPEKLCKDDSFHDKNLFYETWTVPYKSRESQYKGHGIHCRIRPGARVPNQAVTLPNDYLFEPRSDLLTVSQGPIGSGSNWV